MTAGFIYLPGALALTFVGLAAFAPRAAMCVVDVTCPSPYDTILATDYKICNCNAPNDQDFAFISGFFNYWETTGTVYTYQGTQCCQVQGIASKQFKVLRDTVPQGYCQTGVIRLHVTGSAFPQPNPYCPSGVGGTFEHAYFVDTSPGFEMCGS